MDINQELKEKLAALEIRVAKLEALISATPEVVSNQKGKKISAREFLKSKGPSTTPDIALVLGYYLEKLEGMSSFNVGDIETAFRAAKEKPPKNLNDTIYKCAKRGHMMDAPEKKGQNKAWCLTSSGEEFVENDLGGQSK